MTDWAIVQIYGELNHSKLIEINDGSQLFDTYDENLFPQDYSSVVGILAWIFSGRIASHNNQLSPLHIQLCPPPHICGSPECHLLKCYSWEDGGHPGIAGWGWGAFDLDGGKQRAVVAPSIMHGYLVLPSSPGLSGALQDRSEEDGEAKIPNHQLTCWIREGVQPWLEMEQRVIPRHIASPSPVWQCWTWLENGWAHLPPPALWSGFAVISDGVVVHFMTCCLPTPV